MRFASSGGSGFRAAPLARPTNAVSAIAKLDGGLKIRFTKEGAVVFVMGPATDEFIRDVDAVAVWMLTERGKK